MANKAKIYLYKEGNECNTLTGGWTSTRGGNTNNVTFNLSKNADNLYAYVYGSASGIAELKVHPSNLKFINAYVTKLYVDCSFSNMYEHSSYEVFNVNNSGVLTLNGYTSGSREIRTGDINAVITSINCMVYNNSYSSANVNIYNLYMETDDIITNISYEPRKLVLSINGLGNNISFKKLELVWEGQIIQTYENIITDADISYDFDDSIMSYGDNELTIQVTYNQGDDIPDGIADTTIIYNKDVIIGTIESPIPDLLANTSPREFLDRIYMVNEIVDMFIDNLYKMLAYKGYQLENNLRLSELIEVANDLIHEGSVDETVRQKMITVLTNKGITVTGNETISELIDLINTKL